MIVSILVAMDEKGGIGKANRLPWRLSADLKRFRELTMGHHIIVGRKTYESIGKPLPGRQMIVVTRNGDYRAEGCFVVGSFEQAVSLAQERGESELFVCGGAEIYKRALPVTDRMYLTRVHADVDADTFFPAWNADDWLESESLERNADEKNDYATTFKLLVRKRGS